MNTPNDPTRPAAAVGGTAGNPPSVVVDHAWPPDRRLQWGLAGVGLWLLLFAMGVLVPSEASRKHLGWNPPPEPQAELAKQQGAVAKLQQQLDHLAAAVKNPATAPVATPPEAPAAPAAAPPPPSTLQRLRAFGIAALSFTPINIGLLCILAAFIGGCSVNKEEIWQLQADLAALPPTAEPSCGVDLRRRLNYLTEHPGYSSIRGLVVYLILISGLFVVGGDPVGDGGNQVNALTQYMRLAGLFSFFGYQAGYDPTVFTSLINLGSSRLRPSAPDAAAKKP